MFQNFINIITSPQAAFSAIKEKPGALLPVLLIIVITALVQVLYFSNTDPVFLVDQIVEQTMSEGNGGQENETRATLEKVPPMLLGIGSTLFIVIVLPIILAMFAGYLSFMSKFGSDDIGFKRWFSLVAWTSVVTIFAAIASIVAIMTSADNMIPLDQLSVLSLNNLIFQSSGEFKPLLNGIDITQIWSLVLLIMGYKAWTGKTTLASILTVSMPYILIYGIRSLVIIL